MMKKITSTLIKISDRNILTLILINQPIKIQ